jgi:hypothetical protein
MYPVEFKAPQLFVPLVMSFTKADGLVYKAGLTQPNDPLPAANRTALMLEKNPATAGEDADVPYRPYTFPPMYVLYLAPASDTSGNALFDASNPANGLLVVPFTTAK